MTAMISLNKLQSSPNVNVNVKPSVNVSVGAVPPTSLATEQPSGVENNVIYLSKD